MGAVLIGVIFLVAVVIAIGITWAMIAKKALPPPSPLNADPRLRNVDRGAPPPEVIHTDEVRTPDQRDQPREHAPAKY